MAINGVTRTTNLITLRLSEDRILNFDQPVRGDEVAYQISPSLAHAALAIKVDGQLQDLSQSLEKSGSIEIVTRQSPEALELIRHTCAHVLAEAVQTLFPDTLTTVGPNIENGFYYDFVRAVPFTIDDLGTIEQEMSRIIQRNSPVQSRSVSREEAEALFERKGNPFKIEILRDIPYGNPIRLYAQGEWEDLCCGPHLPTTGAVGSAFKLTAVSGAYWQGDRNNAVVQRIYGTAWRDQRELKSHLSAVEEAERRDHRKIGKELDLFHFQEEAVGSVFWHAKGWALYQALESYVRRQIRKAGYQEVHTPQLYTSKLFRASGHWDMYGDNIFKIPLPAAENSEPDFLALKPMSCPGHIQIFNQSVKSYRDLPLRMAEFGNCHRNEVRGALHGLARVRQMVQDDAHIFCTEDQILPESIGVCDMIRSTYEDLGFKVSRVRLADRPDVRAGSDEVWDKAENALHGALKTAGIDYDINKGDGAFYGPKVEFYLKDAIGREWQCGTLQVDLVLPERLDAAYIGEDGAKRRPVMLHRAVLGSLHRFIGILLEDTAGKLPDWLSPVQAVVCPITNQVDDYAKHVFNQLSDAGIRTELDLEPNKIGAKLRQHSLQKVPNIIIVGQSEASATSVAIRRLGHKDQETLPLTDAINKLSQQVLPPDIARNPKTSRWQFRP